ncbi:MAG: hypothetical protein QW182_07675, partial [Thermosphaera sp.]
TVTIDVVDAPINLNISNSIISNISVRLGEIVRNVTIYFEKLIEKTPEVPSPPGLVYAYHKIVVNIPEAHREGRYNVLGFEGVAGNPRSHQR